MASPRRHFRAPPAIESCGHAFARAEPGELPMIHRVTGLGLLVLAMSLVGCAKYYWSRLNASGDDFARENLECARQAAPNPTGVQYGVVFVEEVFRGLYGSKGGGGGWTCELAV